MERVRNKDPKSELFVRRLVHSMRYRYRLHSGKLPERLSCSARPVRAPLGTALPT